WPSDSLDGTFMIKAGKRDGITKGDYVLVSKTIVGVVGRIFDERSIVHPVGAAQTANTVTIAGREGIYQAQRTGFGSFLIQVPKDVELSEGDSVIIPEFNSHILGRIVSLDTKENSSF